MSTGRADCACLGRLDERGRLFVGPVVGAPAVLSSGETAEDRMKRRYISGDHEK